MKQGTMMTLNKQLNNRTFLFILFILFFLNGISYGENALRVPVSSQDPRFSDRIEELASNAEVDRRHFIATYGGTVFTLPYLFFQGAGERRFPFDPIETESLLRIIKAPQILTIMEEYVKLDLNKKEDHLVLMQGILPALITALHSKDGSISSSASMALILITSSDLKDSNLIVSVFEQIALVMPQLKVGLKKIDYENITNNFKDRAFNIKWNIAIALENLAFSLSPTHPYYRLMRNFKQNTRKLEFMERDFPFRNIIGIYINEDFIRAAKDRGIAFQYSLAMTVETTLSAFGCDVNTENIKRLFPFIFQKMLKMGHKKVLDADTHLLVICHEERYFDPAIIVERAEQAGVKKQNMKILKAPYADEVRRAIKNGPPYRTIWIESHGEPDAISFSSSYSGNRARAFQLPPSLLAEDLKSYGNEHGGFGRPAILDFCHAGVIANKARYALLLALIEGELKELPFLIASSRGVSHFKPESARPFWISKRPRLSVSDFYDASEKAIDHSGFLYFLPTDTEELHNLIRILDITEGGLREFLKQKLLVASRQESDVLTVASSASSAAISRRALLNFHRTRVTCAGI